MECINNSRLSTPTVAQELLCVAVKFYQEILKSNKYGEHFKVNLFLTPDLFSITPMRLSNESNQKKVST